MVKLGGLPTKLGLPIVILAAMLFVGGSRAHHYQELFLANGLDVPNQLPDYLPALLELAASLPPERAGKVLCAIRPRIELLRKRFIDAKLPHAFLLDIVLTETAGLEVKP